MEAIQTLISENYFFATFFLFLCGACVGSFLNVCIYRLPHEDMSIVGPRSHCPACKEPVRWYDNLPIISYIILKAKCRSCRTRISAQYIFVEALSGYLFVKLFLLFGLTPQYFFYTTLLCLLLVSTWVDFKWQIIPDETNFFGMICALLLSTLFPGLHGQSGHFAGFLESLIGLLVGGALIYAVGVYGEFRFKKEAMGGGDVKLLAMIGAFLGWKLSVLTFFLAPFFGSVIGIYAKYVKKQEIIPYGPFLSLGAVVALFAGDKILGHLFGSTDIPAWYALLFGGIVLAVAVLEWGIHVIISKIRNPSRDEQ
jgi:leader peptidase (prepilin peptidase) / N-methyltransferase